MPRNRNRWNVPSVFSHRTWLARRTSKPKTFLSFNWLTDKDRRNTLLAVSTASGFLMIAGYFLWLGQTPTFNLGQATLLLLQAFIVGVLCTIYISLALLAPAWAYGFIGIESNGFRKEQRRAVNTTLAIRSIAAQIFAASFTFLVFTSDPLSSPNPIPAYWGVALNLTVFSGLVLAVMPRLGDHGVAENGRSYLISLICIGLLGLLSCLMLFLPYSAAAADKPPPDWFVMFWWLCGVVLSAALGTLGVRNWKIISGTSAAYFFFALLGFDAVSMPFKLTAFALGIAAAHPVTIVVPAATCLQLQRALSDIEEGRCGNGGVGVFTNVQLMNTLGDRWVIREKGSKLNVIFDGKGVLVTEPVAAKRKA